MAVQGLLRALERRAGAVHGLLILDRAGLQGRGRALQGVLRVLDRLAVGGEPRDTGVLGVHVGPVGLGGGLGVLQLTGGERVRRVRDRILVVDDLGLVGGDRRHRRVGLGLGRVLGRLRVGELGLVVAEACLVLRGPVGVVRALRLRGRHLIALVRVLLLLVVRNPGLVGVHLGLEVADAGAVRLIGVRGRVVLVGGQLRLITLQLGVGLVERGLQVRQIGGGRRLRLEPCALRFADGVPKRDGGRRRRLLGLLKSDAGLRHGLLECLPVLGGAGNRVSQRRLLTRDSRLRLVDCDLVLTDRGRGQRLLKAGQVCLRGREVRPGGTDGGDLVRVVELRQCLALTDPLAVLYVEPDELPCAREAERERLCRLNVAARRHGREHRSPLNGAGRDLGLRRALTADDEVGGNPGCGDHKQENEVDEPPRSGRAGQPTGPVPRRRTSGFEHRARRP